MTILNNAKNILLDPKVFFLLIAFLLIQLWFSKNLLFGGTEVGIPTYTPGKILDQIKWVWWESLGPGISIPTVSAAIPLYAFMAILESIGLSAIAIQKILFFIIIYLQGLGAGLVFKTIFPKSGKLLILAGLFYIFNPYMMTYIWHRFIYTNFILSAVLPLLIYFYLQLLDKEKLRYIFYFLLTSLASSYMFSAIAPVMAIWLAVLSIFITAVVLNRFNPKKVYSTIFLSLLLFICWLATNLWWIYPLSQNQEIFKFFSTRSNVEVLTALSEKSTISNVVRGINPYSLFEERDWGEIYKSLPFQLLSWIPFIFFLFGIISIRSSVKVYFLIILFIFGVFMSKGSAEPLGFVNIWLYSHFFILGAIKNPFEKLGLLVFLPISILATVGISNFWNLYKKYYQRVLVIIAVLGCALYIWPMWSDKLFGSNKYPPFFSPPSDYLEASIFLSGELKKDEGKILHLPIGEGDSTTYLWPYLYNGSNLANHLFQGISIARFVYVPFIDRTLEDVAKIFHTNNDQLYNQIFHDLGVKYVILNKDIDWFFRDVDDPKFIEAKLDKYDNLVVLKETKHLKIYKYVGKPKGKFNIPKEVALYTTAGDRASDLGFTREGLDDGERTYFEITPDKNIPDSAGQKIFPPKRRIIDRAEFRDKQDFIPPTYYEKYLPGSIFYPFILKLETIKTFLIPSYDKPLRVLLLTTKRLREAQRLQEQGKESLFNDLILKFSDDFSKTLRLFYFLKNEKINDERLYLSKYILRQERKDLENLLKFSKEESIKTLIKSSLKKIDEFNKYQGFDLIYPIDDAQEFINKDSYSYQFSLGDEFKGNLIVNVSNSDHFGALDNRGLFLFVDGKKQQVLIKRVNDLNWSDLGKITLQPGDHEITIPIPNDNNMVTGLSQFKNTKGLIEVIDESYMRVNTLTDGFWMDYKLSDYNPEEKYLVRFYYRVLKGNAPVVEIIQEKDDFTSPYNDKIIKTKDIATIDSYDFDWRYFETSFGKDRDVIMELARSTRQPSVRISVPAWNNCEANNLRNRKLCANKEFRKGYDRPSIVEFRDIKITKLFHAQTYLIDSQRSMQTKESKIEYRKISPVEYQLMIDSPNPNFYIIFNESYHPGWKLEFTNGGQKQKVGESNHYLVNGYANGWFIPEARNLFANKSGRVNLTIKFVPQEYLNKGVVFSIVAYLIITFFMIGRRLRRNE